jgi:hypothetical protein
MSTWSGPPTLCVAKRQRSKTPDLTTQIISSDGLSFLHKSMPLMLHRSAHSAEQVRSSPVESDTLIIGKETL